MNTISTTTRPSGATASGALSLPGAARSAAATVRIDVELATLGSEAPAPRELIPLFHELVREQGLDDLLIDVADYSHVPEGPGLVLVGHDAVISYRDRIGGPAGQRSLLYSRRRESWRAVEPGSATGVPAARLRAALRSTLAVAALLEQRLGERMRWDTRSFDVLLNDRLHAPNADAARLAWRPEVEALAARLFPEAQPRVVDRGEDPREQAGFRIEGSAWAEPLEAVLGRLG
jgi:hypothetical protein